MHPFKGSVTVTEYCPAVFTVFVADVIPPPQSNVTPVVVDEALSVTIVMVQVRSAGGAIVTFGMVMFWITVTEADAWHPVDGSVAVTVYDPGVLTVFVAVVTPPPQSKVTPSVVEDAVKVTLGTAQVRSAGGAIVTFGSVPF